MHILFESLGHGWSNISSEKNLDKMTVGGNPARAFPLLFQQSKQFLKKFSPHPETGDFTGVSGKAFGERGPYRAYFLVYLRLKKRGFRFSSPAR